MLAEAYGKVGEVEQGLAALVDALAQVEQTGERWYEAELYRLKGQLTLQQENQKSKSKGRRDRLEFQVARDTPDNENGGGF